MIHFHTPPLDLRHGPAPEGACALRPDALRPLLQPREGIRLGFLVQQPGASLHMRSALFLCGDEVEAAWRFADSVRASWAHVQPPLRTYTASSWGPPADDDLFRDCEGTWSTGEDA